MYPVFSSYQAEHRGLLLGMELLLEYADLSDANVALCCDNRGVIQHLCNARTHPRQIKGEDINILMML